MATANAVLSFSGFIRRLTAVWALTGGVLIAFVVAANVWSVASAALAGRPLPGVYELVQVAIAVAMFMCLPYCQVTGGNVTADIFTAAAGNRAKAFLAGLGAAIALAFALFLIWRMYFGMADYLEYRETTAIYRFPHWVAFVPILLSLGLMAVAALANLLEAAAGKHPDAEMADH